MPIAKVHTGTIVGLDALPITVEVNIESRGFPSFNIVGLASKEVDESKIRIRSAITNCGYDFPTKDKISVNLAPAGIPKNGSLYDLPIAIGILKATGQIHANLDKKIFTGELSLDGEVKSVKGTAIILGLFKHGFKSFYIPQENLHEMYLKEKEVHIKPCETLNQIIRHLEKICIIKSAKIKITNTEEIYDILLDDIEEQTHAKRALLIASCGGHNLALSGPPGTGKSMIAKAMQAILPPLSKYELEEVIKIRSINGNLNVRNIFERPFRSPHHTISRVGLIGGGSKITPGEITLAHRGILFMDELNEFPRSVIESLRQPLEDKEVSISRASGNVIFPTSFCLIVANNPCPCGYLGSSVKECTCKINDIRNYQRRVSGPIWDRIDIYVTMKEFDVKKIGINKCENKDYGIENKTAKEIVKKVREIQRERYKDQKHKTNSEQSNKNILNFAKMEQDAKNILDLSCEKLGISPRGYFKIIKVARTIADIENSETINKNHILEAVSYRKSEYNY